MKVFTHRWDLLTRYLQQQASPTDKEICAFHFFNTFFYNKLKDAVSEKVMLVSLNGFFFLQNVSIC